MLARELDIDSFGITKSPLRDVQMNRKATGDDRLTAAVFLLQSGGPFCFLQTGSSSILNLSRLRVNPEIKCAHIQHSGIGRSNRTILAICFIRRSVSWFIACAQKEIRRPGKMGGAR
jgi:hypothetical protein